MLPDNIKKKEVPSLELTWIAIVETKTPVLKRKSEIQIFIPMRIPCEDDNSFRMLYQTFKQLEGFSYKDISETVYNVFGGDFYLYDLLNYRPIKSAHLHRVSSSTTYTQVFSEKNKDERKKLWILTFSLDCEEDVIFNKYLYSSIEDVGDIERDLDTIIENFNGDGTAFRSSLKNSKYMKYCSPHIDIFDEEDILDATLIKYECRDLYPVYTEDPEEDEL